MSGAGQACWEGLWRCQVRLRGEDGVAMRGEERVVQILGWRVVMVGMGACLGWMVGWLWLEVLEVWWREGGKNGV
jgi:hypothetical protein